ncbi:hypothetical protein BDV30DRAFT_203216 [Aspergillus minisclerotigenes]|uniref:Uncharacterized protein n=1 Tax=Aspergillus minisclerotigenes TaxID=656917 RepID=A0A5N6JIQ6_9EURO|nr:hypothetical protein BDV30DRAFT_203216 [Aspergillus minisclerotigenes]
MGESPPFLYGTPSAYRFDGPTDRPFNPKAVTQASWTRPPSKPKPKGPLVNFNRHPDSYCNIPGGKSKWTPMHPNTKNRVIYGRKVQLGLRILQLIGALGSLFCAIVIKNAAAALIWIVRVGPAVAILHTLYGIYHLCRSITRPAGTQASYMLFCGTFDLGLVPFYVFAAYLGFNQYTDNAYHWSTLLSPDFEVSTKIAQATFLLSVINGGLHAISLGISIFLGLIFRKITRLPPDLNPLEDNLTARPHKRNKSEITKKHTSSSTLDSTMSGETLIGAPRTMSFMHTRAKSSEVGASTSPSDARENRLSQMTMAYGHDELPVPLMPFGRQADTAEHMMYQLPDQDEDILTRPTTRISYASPVRERSPDVPSRSQCASPASENWIAFPSRSASPVEEGQKENLLHRDPSSVYSRTTNTPASGNSGPLDWFNNQRIGWELEDTIREDVRGEYESVPIQEYYGNDDENHYLPQRDRFYDNAEEDIGDHPIHIFEDHGEVRESSESLRVNPLALNPPTPQPAFVETPDDATQNGRMALVDIPNLSPNPTASPPPVDSPEKNGRFYGELESKTGLSIPRNVSNHDEDTRGLGRKKSKLMKRRSQKMNTYGALKQHDDAINVNENGLVVPPRSPMTVESDRKGRVVSNSGADFGPNVSGGSALSYGNYIAGLGVGRRRDVSGKVAEEGRGGMNKATDEKQTIRAAGWARFAGL